MAKKKVAKKPTKKAKSEGPNYKWDTWLNGKKHTLKSGKDFVCTPKSFVHYLRKRGIQRGKTVNVEYLDNGDVRILGTDKYTGVQTDPLQLKGGKKKSAKKKTTKKKVTKKKSAKKKTTKKKG